MDLATLPHWSAAGVAVAAGAASFLSPCVAPLLPGYVAFVAGSDGGERALARALGFVAGFVLLFALLGATAAAASRALLEQRSVLELVSGLLVALLGLTMAFDRGLIPHGLSARMQAGTARLSSPANALVALPIGAAFAIAWSPCIGPALAAILALAAGSSQPAWGATLLVAYGIGLGLPFLAGALALERVTHVSRRLRRHAPAIRIAGGVMLVIVGVAMATGQFGAVTAQLARLAPDWLV